MAEVALNLAASSYRGKGSDASWVQVTALPAALVSGGVAANFISLRLHPDGRVRVQLSGPDFADAVETSGIFTLTVGTRTIDFGILGADLIAPYEWLPSNSAEFIALYNTLPRASGGTAATLVLRDGPKVKDIDASRLALGGGISGALTLAPVLAEVGETIDAALNLGGGISGALRLAPELAEVAENIDAPALPMAGDIDGALSLAPELERFPFGLLLGGEIEGTLSLSPELIEVTEIVEASLLPLGGRIDGAFSLAPELVEVIETIDAPRLALGGAIDGALSLDAEVRPVRLFFTLPPIGPYSWPSGVQVAFILPAAMVNWGNVPPDTVYTVGRLPTGLDFDSARRRIHGTPLRDLSGTILYEVEAPGYESAATSGDYAITGEQADPEGRTTGPFNLPQLPRDTWVRLQDPAKLRGSEGERGTQRQRIAQQLGSYHERLQRGFNEFSERASPKPTKEARDARKVPALNADGTAYELVRLDRVFLPFYNSGKDIAQAILQSATALIDPRGITTGGGDVVLIADANADAVWGVRALGRRSTSDIGAAVLRQANASIDPRGIARDAGDGTILIADAHAGAIWGFLNGARHPDRDIPAALLRVANARIQLSGVAVAPDGDVFALDSNAPAAWAIRGNALVPEKHVTAAVMRQANPAIDPQGIAVDDVGDQFILDAQAVAIWGMRNGNRHSAKDIASAILRAANADIDPSGMALDDDLDLLVLDREADAVWGISPYRHVG